MKKERFFQGAANFSLIALFMSGQMVCSAKAIPKSAAYPHIRYASLTLEVQEGNSTVSKEIVLRDLHGKPIYRLSLYAVSLDHRTTRSIHVELTSIGSSNLSAETKYEPDLLNPDRFGHGAGQRVFSPDELCSANTNNPFWGARRVFELRRMKIEVVISDIELNQDSTGILHAHVDAHVSSGSSLRSRPKDPPSYNLKPCI